MKKIMLLSFALLLTHCDVLKVPVEPFVVKSVKSNGSSYVYLVKSTKYNDNFVHLESQKLFLVGDTLRLVK